MMIDKLQDLRDGLIRRRDRIDAKIELLDQLLVFEEDDGQFEQESETQDGIEKLPLSDAPPSSGRVSRSPRAAQAAPKPRKRNPALASVPKRRPVPPVADLDLGPTDIGQGKKEVKEGSNMEKVVDAIRCRAPHWVTHDGMVESAKALGVAVPKTFKAITHQECITLRKCDHAVPGLQFRKVGRRIEYRILADGHELTEEEE